MKAIITAILLQSVIWSMLIPAGRPAVAQTLLNTYQTKMKDIPNGFRFRLSEGTERSAAETVQQPASSDPLSAANTSELLGRVPNLTPENSDQQDFAKRLGTLPPPKTGRMIPVKFPSDQGRGTPKVDPGTVLEVVRYSPEGEVSLAPDLSISFSQPMVAVTSQQEAAQFAPVEFSPAVEGRWRWLGTKTLMFDTDKRFPMATKFTARVPAGTKAANGQVLAKDFTWTFTTPPPKVEQMIPQNQIVRRDAIMFVSFDQAVSPAALIKTISLTSGGRKIPFRLATQSEVDADGSISYRAKETQPGRWIAIRAIQSDGTTDNALPAASPITINIQKGTASAEGPIVTVKDQVFQFNTFGPFKYVRAMCGWAQNPNCSPFETWMIEFNNSIDGGTFTKESVKV
ncbi:MAG: Ig-like domain-containing protein, partial [Acidobacteriota bacterium]